MSAPITPEEVRNLRNAAAKGRVLEQLLTVLVVRLGALDPTIASFVLGSARELSDRLARDKDTLYDHFAARDFADTLAELLEA